VLTFVLLLGSAPFETIQLARTLLRFTGLATTDLANEGREQCHGDHLVTVRASEHSLYYPKQVSLSQGGIVVSGPFSGLRRVFLGRLRGVGTDGRGWVPDSSAAGLGSEGRRGGEKEKLFYFSASKVKKIGDLGDESPFPDFPCCTPPLVIDQEKITQGFVNDVKADVTGNFLYRTIVLDQGV